MASELAFLALFGCALALLGRIVTLLSAHERALTRLADQHLVYLDRETRKISTLLSAILNEHRRER